MPRGHESDGETPQYAAQAAMGPNLTRRFYKAASVQRKNNGYSVTLDGKPVKTPGRKPLILPTRAAAKLVCNEWRAQGDHIDPATMPFTRLANTAIDGIAGSQDAVIADIVKFAGSDLICYRAAHPEKLAEIQATQWDPLLDWLDNVADCRLKTTTGITHVEQSRDALDAFAARLGELRSPFELAGLHALTTLTGSAVIALAVAEQWLGVEQAWEAAHIDEDWNISQWGEDGEAAERRKQLFTEMSVAADLLRSLG